MPISVTCDVCGKSLRVKDDWAGKRAKCPGCGATFLAAGAPAFPVPTAPGRTAFNPAAAAAAKREREKEVGRFSVSWGPVMGVVALLLVGLGIGLFLIGPRKVWNEWEKIGDDARYHVIDVVTLGLESHLSQQGLYNPRKPHGRPQATEVMFYRPTMVMSMPDRVEFNGASTAGPFSGTYHPKTGEVEADVVVGGGAHIPGSGGKAKTGYSVKVTGRKKGGATVAEVNGKNAVLHYPPKGDDE